MIPVTQTKVVVRNSAGEIIVNGNCYAAAIASIMELPITEVPNVEVFFSHDTLWWETMNAFLNLKGWELCTDDRFRVFHDGTWGTGEGDITSRIDALNYCKGKYYFVSGPSPRGVNHVCIYKDGQLVHDPHPTREGILELKYFESLEKKN